MPVVKIAKQATCVRCVQAAALDAIKEDGELEQAGFKEIEIMFAAHPLAAVNSARAAREVGYSVSYADKIGYKLKKKLWPLIVQFQKERAARFAISKEAVQHELAAIGFANILDYIHVDEVSGEVTTKKLSELTRDQAAAIQEYELMPVERPDPDDPKKKITVNLLSKIRLFDKRSALVDLGKTIGMFSDKMHLHLPKTDSEAREDVPLSRLSTEALEQIHKIVQKAASEIQSAQADTRAIPGQCVVVKDVKK